jgi:S-adenosylmethionine:tRNA ribosyltransferase-isomerase
VVRPHEGMPLEDRIVRDLPDLLRPGDQLVVNDTKVIPARLRGRRLGGATMPKIEATLIRRLDGAHWLALVKPARKLAAGDVVRFGGDGSVCFLDELDGSVESKGEAGEVTFAFSLHGPALDDAVAAHGEVPLPPYIAARRAADAHDRDDYQTLFAVREGAVAAPTAGLHFTPDLTARLGERGIAVHKVTLHVGPGTFLPVKTDDVAAHAMHAEWGEVTPGVAASLNAARAAGGRIVAVGTTSLRLLESAVREDGVFAPFAAETALFITPGYRFRAADLLLTNFHLPRSTLFMLVAAFCGLDTMKHAYAHAIAAGYRFYSYGDACLLFRA